MTAAAKVLRLVRISAAPLYLLVWVAAGAIAARIGAEFLYATPVLGKLFVYTVAAVFGLGGIFVFGSRLSPLRRDNLRT